MSITYAAFGGRLRSALPFPELRPAHGAPDWTLDVGEARARPAGARALGEAAYAGGVTMRLWRHAGGLRLETSDVGAYEIASGGALRWETACAGDARARMLARHDVLGRALPLALHAGGALCLHASGAVLGDGAVALVAPKRHGKSTLALALARHGGLLLSDDVLPVDPRDDEPTACPGVHAVRLWPDSARHLVATAEDEPGDRKLHVRDVPLAWRAESSAPLRAIYLLAPAETAAPVSAVREPVPATEAALALVAHATNGRLLAGAEAATILARTTAVARRVPAYRLRVARDLARLDDAVARVLAWHGGPVHARRSA